MRVDGDAAEERGVAHDMWKRGGQKQKCRSDMIHIFLPESEGYGKKRSFDDRNDNPEERDGGNKRPNFGSSDRPSGLKVIPSMVFSEITKTDSTCCSRC